jgi:hypothetical protein
MRPRHSCLAWCCSRSRLRAAAARATWGSASATKSWPSSRATAARCGHGWVASVGPSGCLSCPLSRQACLALRTPRPWVQPSRHIGPAPTHTHAHAHAPTPPRVAPPQGGFMEQWHQKLHNNSSPDDVVICQALLDYLASGQDARVYWATLGAAGARVRCAVAVPSLFEPSGAMHGSGQGSGPGWCDADACCWCHTDTDTPQASPRSAWRPTTAPSPRRRPCSATARCVLSNTGWHQQWWRQRGCMSACVSHCSLVCLPACPGLPRLFERP